MDKLIPLAKVRDATGLGRSTLYKRLSEGTFPRGCKVGRRSLWVEAEVQAWIAEQIAERDMQARIAAAKAAYKKG